MKKLLIAVALVAVLLGVATMPAFAERPGYGEQPGYSQASYSGATHGAFGAFDGDYNLGTLGPGAPLYHDGARGQDPGATGYNNSHVMGNPPF